MLYASTDFNHPFRYNCGITNAEKRLDKRYMEKKALRVMVCVAMTAASLLALSIAQPIAPSEASTPTAMTCSEPRGEKPIVFDRQAPERPIVDVSSELMAKDAKSKGYDVSDEEWREDAEYVESMASRLDGIATDTGYAIAIDTSTCRVGIFAADGSRYTLEMAFNADLGYIDESTGTTHTFTGAWHIDHHSETIPEGASFFTCFVPCWGDDGTDDGQGFHSGYDGNPGYESAGCTRLFYNDARYIYDNMPDGTPVIVY